MAKAVKPKKGKGLVKTLKENLEWYKNELRYEKKLVEQLKKMKPTAFVINCARGGLVNEADLAEALKAGEIAGAGIDAFCSEPPTGSPLLEMDNVIAAPHIAGSSIDGINTMACMSARNCVKGLNG